jgi:hypothetical protein
MAAQSAARRVSADSVSTAATEDDQPRRSPAIEISTTASITQLTANVPAIPISAIARKMSRSRETLPELFPNLTLFKQDDHKCATHQQMRDSG